MSDLYKEWQDIVREYIEQDNKIDPYKYDPNRKPTEFTQPSWYDKLTEERKRLNKEYVLNQSSTTVEQNNEENDNG